MKLVSLLRQWRILLLVVALVLSVFAINPSQSGTAIVTSVSRDSPFREYVSAGETLDAINDVRIRSMDDLLSLENQTGSLRVFHNGQLALVPVDGRPLGVEVKRAGSNLNLGLDLVGGTRALLKPTEKQGEEVVEETIATLQTRMNVYGLREMNFQPLKDVNNNHYVQVEVAGLGRRDIEELLSRQGSFRAHIPRAVALVNGSGVFWNQTFSFRDGLFYGDRNLSINDTLSIRNVTFHVWNYTNTSAILAAEVFSGEDIKFVYTDPQSSSLQPQGSVWEFSFQVLVSDEGAARFGRVTADIPKEPAGQYLTESIFLFIDDVEVSSLRIGSSLAGQAYTTPSISGGEPTRDEARKEMRRLQGILKGGSLPSKLEVVKLDTISPSLGRDFISSLFVAGFLALFLVSLLIYFHYRNIALVPLIMMTAVFEMTITLGVASVIKWTIDLSSVAGLIAAIGTGVNDQIVITDEVLSGKSKDRWMNVGQRIKMAFAVIIGSATTIIAAMIPLMFIGIGVMRGFAITTVVGVLVGILITRPAYSRILEILWENK